MLLRNINQTMGLSNGIRLIITQLGKHLIEAEIIFGNHIGEKVFVPRTKMTTKEKKLPFVLIRKKFAIRLSYSITIDKCQGQTLNKIGIYLPKPIFFVMDNSMLPS